NLPPVVRTKMASNLVDPGEVEGAALAEAFWAVTTDTNYATLELALDATPTGGTLVLNGAWSRATPFTVDKACTIVSTRGGSITVTDDGEHGIIVTADNVTIDGVTLIGTDSTTA